MASAATRVRAAVPTDSMRWAQPNLQPLIEGEGWDGGMSSSRPQHTVAISSTGVGAAVPTDSFVGHSPTLALRRESRPEGRDEGGTSSAIGNTRSGHGSLSRVIVFKSLSPDLPVILHQINETLDGDQAHNL
jgi:hypothetical protein